LFQILMEDPDIQVRRKRRLVPFWAGQVRELPVDCFEGGCPHSASPSRSGYRGAGLLVSLPLSESALAGRFIALLYEMYTMAVLPLRLSDDDIRALDALVREGIYKNRSEAARAMIHEGARAKAGEVRDVSGTVRRLMHARRKGNAPFRISRMRKAAVELVAEGRGR